MEYKIVKPPPVPPRTAVLTLSKEELRLIHNAVITFYYGEQGPSQRLIREITEANDALTAP